MEPSTVLELAGPDDADAVTALRDAAARWQLDRGISQWMPGQLPPALLDRQIRAREFFVLRVDGLVVAAVRIAWSDAPIWTDEEAETAGYIHTLVTVQPGRGRGAEVLTWAEGEIGRRGRSRARLDCVASNRRLRAYYRARGYTEVGVFNSDSRFPPLQRFEKYLPHRSPGPGGQ
ncbi:GNAT family N-acetyltransferase [Nakamurella silvestris]|nr:GNAT family N-acetyltransferase [Nakamurella silvestris]